jgi:putative Mg2+ transporter-C (MgtC) family protein
MLIDPEPLLLLGLAALLSLPIGLEREMSGKPAGVRTHLLLAVATAALGWLSLEIAEDRPGTDAARIASYTVAGIGFLGAGLIVGVRGQVHGLTTAVAAFTVMAIGLLCGTGYGTTATALAVVSLLTLGPIEWLKRRSYGRLLRHVSTLHVVVDQVHQIAAIQESVAEIGTVLLSVDHVPLDGGYVVLHLTVRGRQPQLRDLIDALEETPGVVGVATVAHVGEVPD